MLLAIDQKINHEGTCKRIRDSIKTLKIEKRIHQVTSNRPKGKVSRYLQYKKKASRYLQYLKKGIKVIAI